MKRHDNAYALLNAIGEVREEWIADANQSPKHSAKRFASVLAAVLLCAMLTVSALAAADMDGAYELIYALSPTIAQRLKPVRLSCVDNGIELNLHYVDVENDTARVYLSLRDLEDERVDASTDLYDSYEINLPGDLEGHCAYSHFDEESQSAFFLVEVSSMQGKKIESDKLTFSLSCFLSGRQEVSGALDISLADADPSPQTHTEIELRGGDASAAMGKWLVPTRDTALMDGVTLTGLGWVDGCLHVQTHYERLLETDGHGYVWLEGDDGTVLEDSFSASYWDESRLGSYTEQVFDLSALSTEAADKLHLCGSFTSSARITHGDWQITFPLSKQ